MTESFGAGSNGPAARDRRPRAARTTLAKLHEGLVGDRGRRQAVGEPQISEDGTAAMINVIPDGLADARTPPATSSTRCATR